MSAKRNCQERWEAATCLGYSSIHFVCNYSRSGFTHASAKSLEWRPLVATWATSQQLIRATPPPRPAGAPPAAQPPPPAPRPGAAPAPRGARPVPDLANKTLRMIVHTSIGGSRVRIQLANAFGNDPVMIGAAHVAMQSMDSGPSPRVVTMR